MLFLVQLLGSGWLKSQGGIFFPPNIDCFFLMKINVFYIIFNTIENYFFDFQKF